MDTKINRATVHKRWSYDSLELVMATDHYDKSRSLVVDLMFKQYDPNTTEIENYAPILMTYDAAQELMDALWVCGIRPAEGTGTAGAMRKAEEVIEVLKKENERLWALINAKE